MMKLISRFFNTVTSRAKTEQITELLTTVSERTSENDDLRANIKDLDDKIAELEVSSLEFASSTFLAFHLHARMLEIIER